MVKEKPLTRRQIALRFLWRTKMIDTFAEMDANPDHPLVRRAFEMADDAIRGQIPMPTESP